MLFSSPFFLFTFMPLVFFLFFMAPLKAKNTILLTASFLFYFWGEPRFFFIAVLSACSDYYLCQRIYLAKKKHQALTFLNTGIILNVFVLFYYKYLDFFISSSNAFFSYFNLSPLPLLNIALPIGISFIVFEKITYLVDVYRGISKPAGSLKNYLLYIFFFPKLLAGPIVKYHDIAAQLKNHYQTLENFIQGFKRFLLGIIKKVLVADTVAELADKVFALPADQLGFYNAWLGLICFSLQIYLDFSAYSDMAIGLAKMFGFNLLENFNMPYLAINFTDFWRRWHISLSTWIREYLYYPLGGNRYGTLRTYANLWICFLISGLWHGANWNFVIWGAYNGLFLVLDKLGWLRISSHLPRVVNIALTLIFVMFGWAIFRTSSVTQLGYFLTALFHPSQESSFIYITNDIWAAMIAAIIISFVPSLDSIKPWRLVKNNRLIEHWMISALSFFAISRVVAATFKSFLYFRF
ncbi:MBOAT family O-acyltransferase [Legionella micdadei]|uniref:Probable alginate O-acetylase n=1 Tax=Legionella micdadei TaxID=451 RepID=A0A098GJ05_LEGMI|nr:MBOAT family O-acyltransferase [Legionella micdadei]ARG96672.1 membrane-bound O-acyltransferase family protein [Legionella micdadei]KTD26334.1 alginate O-acetylation protein [Legionella micdadei]NSL19090.1 MBOAT family protein [Legionella micdadei]CEG61955.1 poly(beta-D-mannuronate) O-acetylase [Legionella micdadei]SCY67520.1 alginate O-acetyltransferase complex protein AlgI [Legionella micdadei]